MKSATIVSVFTMFLSYCVILPLAHAEVVGAWTFDRGEPNQEAHGRIEDVSGNGHHGKIAGRVKWRPGKRGTALEFFEAEGEAGSEWPGWVEIPHHEDFNIVEFSLSGWVRIKELLGKPLNDGFCNNPCGDETDLSANQMLFGKTSHLARCNYAMWVSDAGKGGEQRRGELGHATFGFTAQQPRVARVLVNETKKRANVVDGKWHHVVGTYREPLLVLYVDGQKVGQRENERINDIAKKIKVAPSPGFAALGGGRFAPFMIGCQIIGRSTKGQRPSYGTAGLIDEVAVFNHALSADEVTTLWRQGLLQYLAVEARGKLATSWGKIKRAR